MDITTTSLFRHYYLQPYVDDIVVIGNNTKEMKTFSLEDL